MNTMIEMYDRIMSVVEEVTGISKDKILTLLQQMGIVCCNEQGCFRPEQCYLEMDWR